MIHRVPSPFCNRALPSLCFDYTSSLAQIKERDKHSAADRPLGTVQSYIDLPSQRVVPIILSNWDWKHFPGTPPGNQFSCRKPSGTLSSVILFRSDHVFAPAVFDPYWIMTVSLESCTRSCNGAWRSKQKDPQPSHQTQSTPPSQGTSSMPPRMPLSRRLSVRSGLDWRLGRKISRYMRTARRAGKLKLDRRRLNSTSCWGSTISSKACCFRESHQWTWTG